MDLVEVVALILGLVALKLPSTDKDTEIKHSSFKLETEA